MSDIESECSAHDNVDASESQNRIQIALEIMDSASRCSCMRGSVYSLMC